MPKAEVHFNIGPGLYAEVRRLQVALRRDDYDKPLHASEIVRMALSDFIKKHKGKVTRASRIRKIQCLSR